MKPKPARNFRLVKSAKLALACFCLGWACPTNLVAAGGELDSTFVHRTGPDSTVSAIVVQPDGKILIAGLFQAYAGTERRGVARLNSNGFLDLTFNPGTGTTSSVSAIALQNDGKVLIGGNFTTFNGAARVRIARLNADGSVDGTFDPGAFGASGEVLAIAVQPDGKILIGGKFATFNNTAKQFLARLNANGSLDATFNASGVGPNSDVNSIALAPSGGKIVIGGSFTNYNTTGGAARVARLNSDGTQDLVFDSSPGANAVVKTVAVQPDGKVLIGGDFSSYGGAANLRGGIARINPDGSLDATFDPGTVANHGTVALALQGDGKVFLVGFFTSFNNVSRNRIARLNANGSLDTSFDPGIGTTGSVVSVAIQPADGRMLIGGSFLTYNNDGTRPRLARLLAAPGAISFVTAGASALEHAGSVTYTVGRAGGTDNRVNATIALSDQSTSPSDYISTGAALDPSFNITGPGSFGAVNAIALAPFNDKIVVGSFTMLNGVARNRIARVNDDGSVDLAFNPGTGALDTVHAVALQPDGKILIGGEFTKYNEVTRNRIARLNSDGSLDLTFDPGTGADKVVLVFALQPDGKILVGGDFTTINGVGRKGIARLNANGSLDSTFDPGMGTDLMVFAIVPQADGSILIGGLFFNYNGVPRNRIARINSDGSLDTSFSVGVGPSGPVTEILQQPDGKLIIVGVFVVFNNVAKNHVARLNSDGTLDGSFDPGTGPNVTSNFNGILQPDGKILLGGQFTSFNGVSRNRLARLNVNGSLDLNFDPGTGASNDILAMALEPTGRILIGGRFLTYQGTTRNLLARVAQGELVVTWPAGDSSSKQFTFGIADDSIDENTETLLPTLGVPTGGATLGMPVASNLQIFDNDPAPTLQFNPAAHSVSEESGVVLLSVTKIGATELTSTVHFTTANGTATSGDDYLGISGDLTFLPAETSKNISVTITNDSGEEGDETFSASLDTPGNATLGAATSATVTIQANDTPNATPTPTATPTPIPGLVGNVSTRLPVGTGDNVLIEGFIVQGPAGSTKKIMVRAIGPSLIPFGIADALANPTLEIRDSSNTVVAANDQWKTTQVGGIITGDQFAEINGSGLAPSDDLESAIIADLTPGSYTAVVRGVGDTSGTGVVDAYDMSAASPARLANIATRGLIQPGDKLMIAGFIIQTGAVRAVVLATGPSLSAFGIANALPDTTLQLRDQNGVVVLENDDWESDQKQELEGTGLQPGDAREAAVVATIQPGQYTVQVRGKPEATGIGVVQVFFLE